MIAKNYVSQNPRMRVSNKQRLPYIPTKDQIIRILSNVKDMNLAMIIFLGIFQGLRISEIIKLKWSEVDLTYGELKVLDGKNPRRYATGYGKDRIVPINDMFVPILTKWKMMNENEEYVIPSNAKIDNTNVSGLARRYQEQFSQAIEKAGLTEVHFIQKNDIPRYKYHLHTLRHICGTNLYRAGMDIYQIKKFLGHEHVETTQLYCDLAKEDIKVAAHKAYAYPKSQLPIPDTPEIQFGIDKEGLRLQKEILDRKLELLKMRHLTIREVC